MVPSDKATTSSYRLAVNSYHVPICSGFATIFNAMLLPASVIHVRWESVSYILIFCNLYHYNRKYYYDLDIKEA